ncbi:ATP-binding protein [Streptodolium elevatio]
MTTELTLLTRVAYRGREITAPRLRGLLALLAEDLRAGCSTGRLVQGLWPDVLPERPGKAVQVLVSRLRAQVGAGLIVGTAAGYRLALAAEEVDSSALLMHAARGEARAAAGDHVGALAEAEAGLALWDGVVAPAADEDLHDPVAALRAARSAAHRTLVRSRALALARLGRRAEAIAPLVGLARELPRDEEVLAELLRCEASAVGPAAALTRYDTYRRSLRDALGADPGDEVKSVHQELLRGTAPIVRHGVLHEPNPLVGRDADVAAIADLVRSARVTTVIGPGGIGKTRIAHAVGRAAEQRTVCFVPLAGVTADDEVAGEVASALGVGKARHFALPVTDLDGIIGALGPGPALLVLDNCEHVVRGAADLVRALVSRSPDLRVIATSRAPLGLTSESLYALPELDAASTVELFRQRARAARPDAELPDEPVGAICRRLDGLPLAVELAAARVRVLSVPQIAERLRDRFALLRGGARDTPERHRTLLAVVEWSWNLLDPDGQAALRMLSVFPGGFTGDAAEHVLGADALSLLAQLADQSLIKAGDTSVGVRFHMLEAVREFSAARRAEAGEDDDVTTRFLYWARDFGRARHDTLFTADPWDAWALIKAEQDNLVLSLRHALARSDGPAIAAVAAVLASLWASDNNFARLAALAADTGPPLSHFRPGPEDVEPVRSAAAVCTVSLFMLSGPRAVRQLVTLRRLPPPAPDTLVHALDLMLRALPELRSPDFTRLRELCASDAPLLQGVADCFASYLWEYAHDVDAALDASRRMLTALSPLRNPATQMLGLGRVSELCLQTGRGEEAYRHLRHAVDVLNRSGDWSDSIGFRWALALACVQRGEVEEAEHWLELAALDQPRDVSLVFSPDLASRAEIALARNLTEAGLGLWRKAVERVRADDLPTVDDPFAEVWSVEVRSAAVAAHALHGRVDAVADTARELRSWLYPLLSQPVLENRHLRLPAAGTALLAVGLAVLAEGDAAGVRLVVLAEHLHVHRQFPSLSADVGRRFAERVDAAGYAEAVSAYAALSRPELEATAARELRGVSVAARG